MKKLSWTTVVATISLFCSDSVAQNPGDACNPPPCNAPFLCDTAPWPRVCCVPAGGTGCQGNAQCCGSATCLNQTCVAGNLCSGTNTCTDINCKTKTGNQQASCSSTNGVCQCFSSGQNYGDPHLVTWRGIFYDFQAVGEFVLTSDFSGSEVQVRFQKANRGVSLTTALATLVAGSRIAIYSGRSAPLWIDGNAHVMACASGQKALATRSERCHERVSLAMGASVEYDQSVGQAPSYTIAWPGMALRMIVTDYSGYLDIGLARNMEATDDDVWVLHGLLGELDGDSLVTRQGQQLTEPVAFDQLYRVYGESWRITQSESLFDYGPGEDTETFTDRSFPEAPPSLADVSPEQLEMAARICRNADVSDPILLGACTLDVATTGNPDFATSAANATPPVAVLRLADPSSADQVSSKGVEVDAAQKDTGGCQMNGAPGPGWAVALPVFLAALFAASRRRSVR